MTLVEELPEDDDDEQGAGEVEGTHEGRHRTDRSPAGLADDRSDRTEGTDRGGPHDHHHEFTEAVRILSSRCDDIDNGTSCGVTPRTPPELPHPDLRFLAVWPSDDLKIGPDFNAKVIADADSLNFTSSRYEAVKLLQKILER